MRRAAPIIVVLALVACGPATGPQSSSGPPERLRPASTSETLHLVGQVSGTFPGLGPSVQLEVWLRADGRARLTLRSERDGRPTHEVLVWTPEGCVLFDATNGKFIDLGSSDGTMDALGNSFRLRDAVFLVSGRDPVWPADEPTELVGGPTRFRGVRESGTLRREGREAGMRWLAEDGTIHDIAVSYSEEFESSWGRWPGRVTITGSDLKAAARLQWDRWDPIVVLGDSIFDPLWEPEAR